MLKSKYNLKVTTNIEITVLGVSVHSIDDVLHIDYHLW